MDNVTHALAGLLIAESAHAVRRRGPSASYARVAAIVGVVAAELPDADLAYSGSASGGGRLGYLLHHRGHTHTVVAAVLGALLVWGVARWLARESLGSAADRRWLLAVALLGTLSHLALDYTNNYGIHPFWPLDDRWFYGDAVFIVEPWLWVVSIPVLLRAASAPLARIAYALLLAAIVAAAWAVGMVSHGAAVALTLGALAGVGVALLPGRSLRVVVATLWWLALEAGFVGASSAARRQAALAAGAPAADIVLTPAISDPLCWSTLVLLNEGATYRVVSGSVAPFPRLRRVDACPSRGGSALPPTARPTTTMVRWDGEWSGSRVALAAMGRDNCVIAAALHFIRVPAFEHGNGTERVWDVRFGRGGFATIEAPERPGTCPPNVPPWVPPRADLLEAR